MKSIDFSENMYYNKTHTDTNMEEIMAVIDKSKALDTALAQIEKQFGKGAVMRLGQEDALQVEAIPTGSLSLDLALGIGGLPRGRIVEIYGPESSGKTTLALHCMWMHCWFLSLTQVSRLWKLQKLWYVPAQLM